MARLRKTHITCTLLAKVKGEFNERVVKLAYVTSKEKGVGAGQYQSKSKITQQILQKIRSPLLASLQVSSYVVKFMAKYYRCVFKNSAATPNV